MLARFEKLIFSNCSGFSFRSSLTLVLRELLITFGFRLKRKQITAKSAMLLMGKSIGFLLTINLFRCSMNSSVVVRLIVVKSFGLM